MIGSQLRDLSSLIAQWATPQEHGETGWFWLTILAGITWWLLHRRRRAPTQ
jgi:hypothetical protein